MKLQFAVVFVLMLISLSGCGQRGAKITGALLVNGAPLKLRMKEGIDLTMIPVQRDEKSLKASPGAEVDLQNATFVFIGPDGGLVAPGEYKITLVVRPRDGADRFAGAFSLENTPLSYTVNDDPEQYIVIDAGKKTVSRQVTAGGASQGP